ncbi:MAG: hypothetical protein A2167_02040 [Planctomycetes bacterium RBG_13_46_10]|nr:MAG: hypothetical protein A2167_02040 [Planctomycetes bacterium RBG_13_46_10]
MLREIADVNEAKDADSKIQRTALIKTTEKGNSFKVDSSTELMFLQPEKLMSRFFEGTKPVTMGYLITGCLTSSFPDGIEIEVDSNSVEDPNDNKKIKKQITGLKQAQQDCVVAVFSDVDFISDMLAYQNSFFGKVVVGDNSALLMNTVDDLTGSSDLISIRSRGNFQRPFTVVKDIEEQAEKETEEEVAKLNAEIQGFNNELQVILASAKEEKAEVIGSSILQKQKELELKKRQAQRQLRDVRKKRHERIEALSNKLRNFNMLTAPAAILVIAVVLAIRRSARKRHYISHASDA